MCLTVPGEPQNVQARPVNSSAVEVSWDPPVDKDQNGVIRGYQIHVQPKNMVRFLPPELNNLIILQEIFFPLKDSQYYTPLTFSTTSGEVTKYVVTGLEPDTKYIVQVIID